LWILQAVSWIGPNRNRQLWWVVARDFPATRCLRMAVGFQASKQYSPTLWSSNSRGRDCSFFTIGRFMLDGVRFLLKPLMLALRNEVLTQKWG